MSTNCCINSLGPVVQIAYTGTSAAISNPASTLTSPNDALVTTTGVEILTIPYVPLQTTNILEFDFNMFGNGIPNTSFIAAGLFQDSNPTCLCGNYSDSWDTTSTTQVPVLFKYRMTAGTTSSTTFKIRIYNINGSGYINAINAGTRLYGGVASCWFIIKEYSV